LSQQYPKEYEKTVTLLDGTNVFLRPELSTDTEMLWQMFSTLQPESLSFLRGRFSRQTINRWTENIDYDKHLMVVAVVEEKGNKKIIASATLSFFKDSPAFSHKAGLAIKVHDDYHNKGLGKELTRHMLDIAKKKKLRKISLGMREDNAKAIHLYEKFRFKVEARLKDEHLIDGKYYDDYIMSVFL